MRIVESFSVFKQILFLLLKVGIHIAVHAKFLLGSHSVRLVEVVTVRLFVTRHGIPWFRCLKAFVVALPNFVVLLVTFVVC